MNEDWVALLLKLRASHKKALYDPGPLTKEMFESVTAYRNEVDVGVDKLVDAAAQLVELESALGFICAKGTVIAPSYYGKKERIFELAKDLGWKSPFVLDGEKQEPSDD